MVDEQLRAAAQRVVDAWFFKSEAHAAFIISRTDAAIDGLRSALAAHPLQGAAESMERGQWTFSDDGRSLYSDDFTHDVCLKVMGDFEDAAQRKAYAEEIARRLSVSAPPALGEMKP